MTTTTTETLAIGSLVLNTLGYNVETWQSNIGSHRREARFGTIPRRSAPLRRRPQEMPTELDVALWISTRDADGVEGGRARLWSTIDTILREIGDPGSLVTLTRNRNGIELTADAEFVGPLDWSMISPAAVRVSIPFVLPFPYWQGEEVSTLLTGGDGNVENTGQVNASRVAIALEAGASGWTNPVVQNSTLGITLSYAGTIPSNDTIFVDLFDGTVYNEAGQSRSGSVSVNGYLFELRPGTNTISTGEGSGSGNVRFTFRPPFIA